MPGKRDPDDPNYMIHRIDYGVNSAYVVIMTRNGKRKSEIFSSRKCGGDVEALIEARRYRDELLKNHGPGKNWSRGGHRQAKPGYGYLRRTTRYKQEPDGSETHFDVWYGYMRLDDGKYYTTQQSIEKHGEYGAFERAKKSLAIEREQLATRLSRARLPPPVDLMPTVEEPPVSMRYVRKRRKAS